MLLTDGVMSFAVFLYVNPDAIAQTLHRVVGFDAGDNSRSAVLLVLNSVDSDSTLEEVNVFRIDGKVLQNTVDFLMHLCRLAVHLFLPYLRRMCDFSECKRCVWSRSSSHCL